MKANDGSTSISNVLFMFLSCFAIVPFMPLSINRSFARYYGNTVPHLLLIANNQKPKLKVAFKQCFSLGIVNLFYCFHTGCLKKCRFSGNPGAILEKSI